MNKTIDIKLIREMKQYRIHKIPVDTIALAKKNGFSVYIYDNKKTNQEYSDINRFAKFDNTTRGVIIGDDINKILISDNQSYKYKRFITAYLIGLYFIEREPNFIRYYDPNNINIDALSYAKNVLVPNTSLEKEIRKNTGVNFEKLEETFGVPDFIIREKVKYLERRR